MGKSDECGAVIYNILYKNNLITKYNQLIIKIILTKKKEYGNINIVNIYAYINN